MKQRVEAGAEVDRLLRVFFLTQTPSAWSAPSVPTAQPEHRPQRILSRGRLALAASLLLLIGSQVLLSHFTPTDAVGGRDTTVNELDIASVPNKKPRATKRNSGPEFVKPGSERPNSSNSPR
jgi:hypothetical protein